MAPRVSRRALLAGAAAALAAGRAGLTPAWAQAGFGPARHGLSTFGDLKYPADFQRFDFVNPAAPKGGLLSLTVSQWQTNQNPTTFNSLNAYILKGDGAAGMELTFATLMEGGGDEPDALYGYAAESVQVSDDELSFRFRLRPGITFHDGSPITAQDVAFSLTTLQEKGHPTLSLLLRWMESAKADDERTLTVRFKDKRPRDVPLFITGLPIFSRAYYGRQPFDESAMEAPLGSGRYKVARFDQGRFIEYERVKDHWSVNLPISVGRYNFDRLRYEFFRDRTVALEAFKGGAYLFREEFTSRQWSTAYDFPALKDGRVVRETVENEAPSAAQGWYMNMRRPQFQDRRVREAIILAFDFEWVNQNIMYGAYERTASFFEGSDLKATGKPAGEELALLEPFRGKVPDEVFGEPFVPPVSDGSGADRNLLRQAAALLREAGWRQEGGALRNAKGEPFTLEFLDFEPSFEPHVNAYIANLKRLGIQAQIRRVDSAQYQARIKSFDFDMTARAYLLGATPGEGLKLMFGSDAARTPGSNNLSGIADPAVDALLERVVNAKTRQELTVASRALDRVIRAGRFWVPAWYKGSYWFAYWSAYSRPPKPPRYGRGVVDTWWWDAEKAAKAGVKG